MDFGREIKKITGDFYTLKFIIKEDDGTEYSHKAKEGRIFNTNIDEKGRIYIPVKLLGKNILENRPYNYLYGHMALSSFKCIIYLHRGKAKNKSILNDIEKGLFPLKKIRRDSESECEIHKRIDTNVIINIRKLTNGKIVIFNSNEFKLLIFFKPDFINSKLLISKKKVEINKVKGNNKRPENLSLFEPVVNKMDVKKIKTYIRYRIKIPSDFITFCEIDKYRNKIVVFCMEDEIEIWPKPLWDSYINKRIWLSDKGKFILINENNEWEKFVCAEKEPFLKSILVQRKL